MNETIIPSRRFCVAPMLDWTDRHERYFLRLISKHAWLYTEMVTTGALIYGDTDRYLRFSEEEHPVALQLGGSDPHDMAHCTGLAADYGYDEVNINVGCPSERVQKGAFGACLMLEPSLIAECIRAMHDKAPEMPITVKNRIGVDDQDSYQLLCDFVGTVSEAGCETFIVHARKALLKGLSPKENREIPPLNYETVHRLKQDFPHVEIIINGGFKTLEESLAQLDYVDGVMMGREAYHNPYILSNVDRMFYNVSGVPLSRSEIFEELLIYVRNELAGNTSLKHMTRHVLGLFHGMQGAKAWRRYLSENAYHRESGVEILEVARNFVLPKP
ncbi:MAG: tRNA dihydrouridine synthase A [uncultured Thiotrichaceae bacterium]|uniref:tRNA-dihydrouridine(20/20a) synthase n=1 Tax=uncultured Thiotrichaceae bacterium TaxID=298394 RepID=A0A6S6SG62_9GAMM|nr:MAG: tRNA dihydrouridine synthase A [uncultured Thiotrichaceae bacterium]